MSHVGKVILIGASAGGVDAIQSILTHFQLEAEGCPFVLVLHIPDNFRIRADLVFSIPKGYFIKEAGDKEPILSRHIYLAPGGYHLLIESDRTFALSRDEPVQQCRPSIDVLFESAAVLGPDAVALLLTGANADGAEGLKALKDSNAYTLVQDPEEAEMSAMPLAAISLFKPDYVGTIANLSAELNRVLLQEAT